MNAQDGRRFSTGRSWPYIWFGILGVVALAGVFQRLHSLETELVETISIADASRFSKAINEFRQAYASEVVERVVPHGIQASHQYSETEGAIPLPVTLSMMVGKRLNQDGSGRVRLYSDYPFPTAEPGEAYGLDEFDRAALRRLRLDPAKPVVEFSREQGKQVVRYAAADVMGQSCVDCHNRHPESPKTDWKLGDVRGVLEVRLEVPAEADGIADDLRATSAILLVVALLTMFAMAAASQRIQRGRRLVLRLGRETAEAHVELERETEERRQAQDERDQIQAQAIQAQKLEGLGLLAGGIAHDFNNLLMSMNGNAELAELSIMPGSEAVTYLDRIKRGVEKGARLTRHLQAYAGQGPVATAPTHLSDAVRQTAEVLESIVVARASLTLELSDELPMVRADPAQLEQLVMNLLMNAADACGVGGAIVLRTGTVALSADDLSRTVGPPCGGVGPHIFLDVADNGRGMDEQVSLQMFDPFYSTKGPGRGLGLAAIQGIVRAHRGVIFLDSALGRGTTIRIAFPFDEDADVPIAAAPTGAPPLSVLIVDDDDEVRETTSVLLAERGFVPFAVASGDEAIAFLTLGDPSVDAVILDMTMPGMSGLDTYEAFRGEHSELVVVFVSGYTVESGLRDVLRDTGAAFLQKPYAIDELVRTLLA